MKILREVYINKSLYIVLYCKVNIYSSTSFTLISLMEILSLVFSSFSVDSLKNNSC